MDTKVDSKNYSLFFFFLEELNSGEDGRWKRENGGQAEIETKKKKRKKWKVFRECCKSAG